jgi:glycosyltransferase involved in cell wall biosynthesis
MNIRPRAIHQFHSGSALADAVTNSLFFTQGLLNDLGFESEIFVEHLSPELQGRIRSISEYPASADQALLVHHSMGHDLEDWLLGLPDRRILVYHNVTPPAFYPPDSHTHRYARKGYDLLDTLRPAMSGVIAVSEENRRELDRRGYAPVQVVPLLLDQARLAAAPWDDRIVRQYSGIPVILFVGRIAPNKCHVDLIETAHHLRAILGDDFRLVLVGGGNPLDDTFKSLRERIEKHGLADKVVLAGKVPEPELHAWYRAASVYCSMSEHEGFGVPFLEAMTFDLPIAAFASSAIPEVLGDAGLMFTRKDPRGVAALLAELIHNRALRRRMIEAQRRRLRAFTRPAIVDGLRNALLAAGLDCPVPTLPLQPPGLPFDGAEFQIEGPAENSYSLALVNRRYALALDEAYPGKVGLWITEGPGDYTPSPDDLARHPKVAELWRKSRKADQPRVLIRNLWPPRVSDADGLVNLIQFAWEESFVPADIVADFNRHLDGVLVPSTFCRDVLVNNGVRIPICVAGHGTDHIDETGAVAPDGAWLPEGFLFLHVSSAFPRKGVDALLAAWPTVSCSLPGATLVLKTFPNPHNDVAARLAALREIHPAAASRIHWINTDWPDAGMKWLYSRAHALVCPTRGEGYGLPLAEAMRLGIPVVTTDRGGHADFCREDTAWLVRTTLARSRSHLGGDLSHWFEPDVSSLAGQMIALAGSPPEARAGRVEAARTLVSRHTWNVVASRAAGFARKLERAPAFPPRLRLALVTTWNERCGIATYSRYLATELLRMPDTDLWVFAATNGQPTAPDEPWTSRPWSQDFGSGCDLAPLLDDILRRKIEVVVIQFNFGFFHLPRLADLLDQLHARGIRTLLTLHSTQDVDKPDLRASLRDIRDSLARCHRLLVHSPVDLVRLDIWGMAANAALFPHGLAPFSASPEEIAATRDELGWGPRARILATFGFCLPHKGLRETIQAFASVRSRHPKLRLLMLNAQHPNADSASEILACRKLISELGLTDAVRLRTDFIPEAECLRLLAASELTVFAYQDTAESASGAVRLALSAAPAVLCTPLPIFDDIRSFAYFAEGRDTDSLAAAIKRLIADSPNAQETNRARKHHLRQVEWQICACRLRALANPPQTDFT